MFGARRVARRSARRSGRHIAYRRDADVADGAATAVVPRPAGTPAYAAELHQLADLKDRGIITQSEFDSKKRQILGL